MKVKYYTIKEISSKRLLYAVICAAYKGKWIFVRHRDRNTWEIPGGRREENEDINATASRELFEETGATGFDLEPVCDYSVTNDGRTTYGRIYYARITEMGPLPESEICEVKLFKVMPEQLTYPEIQPHLHKRVLEHIKKQGTG